MMAKTFKELALRPKTLLPLEDIELPDSDEDEDEEFVCGRCPPCIPSAEVSGFNARQVQGNDATTTTLFAPREHEPVSGTTVAAGVANATTPTTKQITQEKLQAETHRITDTWNGVTRDPGG
jgi:hypothetical protein